MKEKLRAVVVTTDKRGVFFGYAAAGASVNGEVELRDAQMCVHWTSAVRGVLGLAGKGPVAGCRVTGSVPSIRLNGVTAIMEATQEAEEAWKKQPWN